MSDNLEIVGFDLGHGESALAHTTLVSANEPEPLSIHNRPTVLSVVGVAADGRVAIGENAVRQSEHMAEMFVRFKALPPADGPWPGERPLVLFVGGIVRELVESRQIPRIEDARVFVGVPSGWTGEPESARRLERYRAALRAAGLLHVEFVPESRAAFMQARESGESGSWASPSFPARCWWSISAPPPPISPRCATCIRCRWISATTRWGRR